MKFWNLLLVLLNQRGSADVTPSLTDPPVEAPPTTAPPAVHPVWGEKLPEFPEGFDKTLIDNAGALKPFLKDGKFNTPEVFKAFIHTKAMVGRDKIAVPKADASQAEWDDVHSRLFGFKTDIKEYDLKKGEKSQLQDEFFEKFKVAAHAARLPVSAAQKMAEFMENESKAELEADTKAKEEHYKQGVDNMKKDWGEAFNRKIAASQRLVKELGGDALIEYLKTSGMHKEPALIRFFAEVGEKIFSEGKIRGDANNGEGPLTPAEIDTQIGEIRGNPKHAFNDRNHPNHKAAQKEMLELYERKEKILAGGY